MFSHSLSDGGHSWDTPRPLRFAPGGPTIPQLGTGGCFCKLSGDRFLLTCGSATGSGNIGGPNPEDQSQRHEAPHVAIAREIRHPDHPLVFSRPRLLMGTSCAMEQGTPDITVAGDITESGDDVLLWYSDRRHYLLGKVLPERMLETIGLPQ